MWRTFAATLLICLVFQYSVAPAYAAEKSFVQQPPIQYDLSYPGLLPDHPFYILKQMRDNMMTLLIGKPLDRSSFMLLQSDKQVSAAKILIEQQKDVHMVRNSFLASQRAFEGAINGTQAAKQEGFPTEDMIHQLQVASKKHHEIVTNVMEQLSEEDKKMFQDIEKKSLEFIPRTASLKP